MTETDFFPQMTVETSSAGRVVPTGTSYTTLNAPQTIDVFLTASEAAKIARLHPVTLLKWAREGRVPHRRLSARKVVFPLSQLTAWLSGYTDSVARAA
jgi:excisionase family DNA binding protein